MPKVTRIGEEDEVDAYDHLTALTLLSAQNEASIVSDTSATYSLTALQLNSFGDPTQATRSSTHVLSIERRDVTKGHLAVSTVPFHGRE